MMPPSPLRIFMTTDAAGGVWVYATALARALCGDGHHVTLVTLGPKPQPEEVAALARVPGLDIEVTDLALEWMDPEGSDAPRACRALSSMAKRVRPDIAHLNGYREAHADFGAPVLVAAHSCVRSWWRACRGGEPHETRWCNYAADVAAGLLAADAWVAPTAAFRDSVQFLYAPASSGRVIWNGTDFSAPTVAKQPLILAAGRLWDEAKNLSALAAVADHLDWPVHVAGPLEEIEGSRASSSTIRHLRYLGVLPRAALLQQMSRAEIFVAPALYEPFGLTVLEAAAAGCALVLSEIPTFRELWEGAALFVAPDDVTGLRDGLLLLSRNKSLRRRYQSAALERAKRYPLSKMVQKYEALYSEMLGAPSILAARPHAMSELAP